MITPTAHRYGKRLRGRIPSPTHESREGTARPRNSPMETRIINLFGPESDALSRHTQAAMPDTCTSLILHLRHAAACYGGDFPLGVPGKTEAVNPVLDPASSRQEALDALREEIGPCIRCRLHENRQQLVFGEGSANARVMFIGEAPGQQEDRQGRPFVGPAGQLLDKIIENAMGLSRPEVFIANVNKCRPPGNRDPQPDEVGACLPFLRRQIEIIEPEVIVTLGRVAAQNLLSTTLPMRRLRGQDLEINGITVVATWHPAYLLRQPSAKADTWEDIKRVNRRLGLPEIPVRKRP